MQAMQVDAPVVTRTHTRIVARRPLLSEDQERSVERLTKKLDELNKPKAVKKSYFMNAAEPVLVPKDKTELLLEDMDLILEVERCQSVRYRFDIGTVCSNYLVNIVGGPDAFLLIASSRINEFDKHPLRRAKMMSISALGLLIYDGTYCLVTSRKSVHDFLTQSIRATAFTNAWRASTSRRRSAARTGWRRSRGWTASASCSS